MSYVIFQRRYFFYYASQYVQKFRGNRQYKQVDTFQCVHASNPKISVCSPVLKCPAAHIVTLEEDADMVCFDYIMHAIDTLSIMTKNHILGINDQQASCPAQRV